MHLRLVLATLSVAFTSMSPSFAQERLKDAEAVRQLSNSIMEKVGAGDMEGGIRLAKPYLIIPEAEVEVMLGQARLQAPAMAQRFGKPVGFEFVSEERAGNSVIRILQLALHERHPMRWNFLFYKTPTGWVLNTFYFDDKIQALFPG